MIADLNVLREANEAIAAMIGHSLTQADGMKGLFCF
jgi:hypothetical protein